jgi:hypothetical protein
MTDNPAKPGESFEDFKRSFSYGARTDLNFKFLAGLADEQAADFFQELLSRIGEVFDDGDFSRIIEWVIEGQIQAYTKPGSWVYDEAPFTALTKPLSESRLALITSTGHYTAGQDPEPFGVNNMTQAEAARRIGDFLKAEPSLMAISMEISPDQLRVRHGGYDIRGVQADPNVAFPLDRLREFREEGLVGELLSQAYSFVGAASQLRILKHAGPMWVDLLKVQHVEAVLLVPV